MGKNLRSNDEFANQLLIALNSEEVQCKILSIISKKQNDKLQNTTEEISSYQKQLDLFKQQLSDKDDLIAQLREQVSKERENVVNIKNNADKQQMDLESKLKTEEMNSNKLKRELTETLNALNKYNNLFDESIKLFSDFKSLSVELFDKLNGKVICSTDLIRFIISCSDINHLQTLWDYIKYSLGNGVSSENIEIMRNIFITFFQLYSTSSDPPTYALYDPKVGDEYDDEKHSRALGSAVRGRIQKIYLPGYYSVSTGKAVRKSIVSCSN